MFWPTAAKYVYNLFSPSPSSIREVVSEIDIKHSWYCKIFIDWSMKTSIMKIEVIQFEG